MVGSSSFHSLFNCRNHHILHLQPRTWSQPYRVCSYLLTLYHIKGPCVNLTDSVIRCSDMDHKFMMRMYRCLGRKTQYSRGGRGTLKEHGMRMHKF